jgi:hypothetical protein
MPKTPVHKNRLPTTSKDKIGLPGKLRGMKGIAIAHAVDETANYQFWLGVLSLD